MKAGALDEFLRLAGGEVIDVMAHLVIFAG